MTRKEADEIGKLREAVAGNTAELAVTNATLANFMESYRTLQSDVYGLPGDKERSPGLMGEVAELRHAHRNLLWGLRCAWGLLTAALGAVVAALLRTKG